MAGYVKIWTTLFSNNEYLGLSGLERGVFLQLLLKCKDQRDDGHVTASGWTEVGTFTGTQRRTAIRVCGKIAATLLLEVSTTAKGVVEINIPNYMEWQQIQAKDVHRKTAKVRQKCTPLRPDQTRLDQTKKEKEEEKEKSAVKPASPVSQIPYRSIIGHLNQIIGSKFDDKAESHRSLIRTLWKAGYREKDFYHVHQVKASEWLNDDKMHAYLRPKTLYLKTNFENYLGQPLNPTARLPANVAKNVQAGLEFLRRKGVDVNAGQGPTGVHADDGQALARIPETTDT